MTKAKKIRFFAGTQVERKGTRELKKRMEIELGIQRMDTTLASLWQAQGLAGSS